jgi:hypothetical protein
MIDKMNIKNEGSMVRDGGVLCTYMYIYVYMDIYYVYIYTNSYDPTNIADFIDKMNIKNEGGGGIHL